jgi:hypothetical protein
MSPPSVVKRAAKVAAVVSSLVLVALYISHRSGGQTTPPSLPGSKGGIVQLPATTGPTTEPAAAATQQHFIYSSKSAPVFKPQAIGGSKFAPVFKPADASVILGPGTVVFPQAEALTLQPTTAVATTKPVASTQPAGKR